MDSGPRRGFAGLGADRSVGIRFPFAAPLVVRRLADPKL